MEKIKRCPFCRNELLEIYDESANFYVFCSSCGAQGPFLKDKPAAITAWNAAANQLAAKDEEIADKKRIIEDMFVASVNVQAENRKLATALSVEKRRVEAGNKRQDELEAEIARLTAACDDMQGDMLKARDERDEAKAEIEKWKAEYVRIRQECDAFNRTNEEVFNKNRKVRADYAELRATLNAMSELLLKTEKQRDALKKELGEWHDMVIPLTSERDEARRVARYWYDDAASVRQKLREENDVDVISDELMQYCRPRTVTVYLKDK